MYVSITIMNRIINIVEIQALHSIKSVLCPIDIRSILRTVHLPIHPLPLWMVDPINPILRFDRHTSEPLNLLRCTSFLRVLDRPSPIVMLGRVDLQTVLVRLESHADAAGWAGPL